MSYTNRWKFELDISAVVTEVFPVYDNNAVRLFEPEPNQVFYRAKLPKFTFLKADFDLIDAATIETEIILIISENIGGTITEINRGKFTKTDCAFNHDSKTVEVQPETQDSYTKVLESLDKEFDIIELGTPVTTAKYKKQGIFQFYVAGRSVLTNIIGENYLEQEVDSPTDDHVTLTQEYFFDQIEEKFFVDGWGDTDVTGEYTSDLGAPPTYTRVAGTYEVAFDSPSNKWNIQTIAGSVVVYEGVAGEDADETTYTRTTGAANGLMAFDRVALYGRLLTDQATVGAVTTDDIFAVDIVAENFNYSKVLGVATAVDEMSLTTSQTAQPFGIVTGRPVPVGETHYFVKPASSTAIYPVGRSGWKCASIWVGYDAQMLSDKEDASDDVTLTECYEIGDVLKELLSEIDSSLVFNQTVTHSDFLYDIPNPISGLVNGRILITPKSNIILSNQLDRAATKAPIRLGELLTLLRVGWNLFWDIDGVNFRIEHRHFYDKGGNYITDQKTDFTNKTNAYTGRKWSYRTNSISYEKQELPERIDWKWMDTQSKPFEGYPVEVTSIYAQKGNIKENNFGPFSADIDFIQATPADVSREGFAVMEINATTNIVPFYSFTVGTDVYEMQNGLCSLIRLIPIFHKYGLPATNVKVNDIATTATTIDRRKTQEIEVTTETEPNMLQLFETDAGVAKIGRAEVSFWHDGTTRKKLKLLLRYNTET